MLDNKNIHPIWTISVTKDKDLQIGKCYKKLMDGPTRP